MRKRDCQRDSLFFGNNLLLFLCPLSMSEDSIETVVITACRFPENSNQ